MIELPHHRRQRDQFVRGGQVRRHRPALMVGVDVELRGGEADRPVPHGGAEKAAHGADLVSRRRPFRRGFAHGRPADG